MSMNRKNLTAWRRPLTLLAAAILALLPALLPASPAAARAEEEEVVLRVCNWEEYIDLGDWGEDEVIDLDSGDIFGENSMVADFEEWYAETYGKKVRVEYSTFGTNEDLYNMLTIGDVYDLVCPSEYMIMKLMAEDQVQPLSEHFFDRSDGNNYYINGVSPYIRKIFETHDINGVTWDKCAAGYMWGITGFVYNPDIVSEEEASTWKLLENRNFHRRITMKDNVRDAYFAALGALKAELLTADSFTGDAAYPQRLQDEMNDVNPETVERVQDYLQEIKDNLYSFETDSGKADMITGKVAANYQWSGDAVYTMDQAEEDDYYLNFAVPKESTNIYFDGWVMLKKGIDGNADRQHAAEAFINFLSRPDNVVRNMYYIGYTSAIAAPDDGRVFEYLDWLYGAETEEEGEEETEAAAEKTEAEGEAGTEEPAAEGEEPAAEGEESGEEAGEPAEETEEGGEDEEAPVEYSVAYFFTEDGEDPEGEYVLTVYPESLKRQLSAQYPSEEVIRRASIMIYFNEQQNEMINRMWIRVRCFSIESVPLWAWITLTAGAAGGVAFWLRRRAVRNKQYE